MSRIGKKPIIIPVGITFEIDGQKVFVKGHKGQLDLVLPEFISLKKQDNSVEILLSESMKESTNFLGLYRSLIINLIIGVTEGYHKELELVGIGYRVQLHGKTLVLSLGYSHEVKFVAPQGIEFKVEGQNKILVTGIDKRLVGQVAADIRDLRPPDAYKGKGVRYAGEVVKTKPGKSVKK